MLRFLLVLLSFIHSFGAVPTSDKRCKSLLSAIKSFRESVDEEQLRFIRTNLIKLSNIDIYDETSIKELVCSIPEKNIKSIEDLHDLWTNRLEMSPQETAVKTALTVYGVNALGQQEIRSLQESLSFLTLKFRFSEITGFPNFPLGLSRAELKKKLGEFDPEDLGEIFYQIAEYDYIVGLEQQSVTYDVDKLEEALYEADTLIEFADRLNGYSYSLDAFDHYNPYEPPKKEDVEKEELLVKSYKNILAALEGLGLFKLPRGHEPINCDDVIDDILEFLDGYEEFFPGEFQMALHDNYLSDEFSDDTKKQKFICQFIESKSLSEIAKLFLNDRFKYYIQHISLFAMYGLAHAEIPLGYINQHISATRIAEKMGFPNFPLKTDRRQARRLVEILSSRGSDGDFKNQFTNALMDANSLEKFFRIAPGFAEFTFYANFKSLTGKTEKAERVAFLLYNILFTLEKGGLFMLA